MQEYLLNSRDDETVRAYEKQSTKRKLERGLFAAAGLVAALSYGSKLYGIDTELGKQQIEHSAPSISHIYESPDSHNQTATFVATGVNTRDASVTAEVLTSYRELGDVFAITYDNRGIDTEELKNLVINAARQHGKTHLNFSGWSAGGGILSEVAAAIYHDTDLEIDSLVFNSTPMGPDSLTEESEEAIQVIGRAMAISPDVAYSFTLRSAADVWSHRDLYYKPETRGFDWRSFGHEVRVACERTNDDNRASAVLAKSQVAYTTNYAIDQHIESLSKQVPKKQPPLLAYTAPWASTGDEIATSDTVVKVGNSANYFVRETHRYENPRLLLLIDNIGHANPTERPNEYNQALTERLLPAIRQHRAPHEDDRASTVLAQPPVPVQNPPK